MDENLSTQVSPKFDRSQTTKFLEKTNKGSKQVKVSNVDELKNN